MIALLTAALLVVVLACCTACRYVAIPVGDLRREVKVSRAFMKSAPGAPHEFHYFLAGPGGPDVGDHDADKYVLRADRSRLGVVYRVAPVDRQGHRAGRSLLILTR